MVKASRHWARHFEAYLSDVSVSDRAVHETRMSYVDALKHRDKWLGITTRNGGIFGALRPTNG